MPVMLGNYNDQNILPVLVDATGRIKMVLDAVTGTYINVDVHTMPVTHVINDAGIANIGWVGINSIPVTQVKSSNNNHLFSYESRINESLSNTNLAGGSNYLYGSNVPANKIYIITHIGIAYVGTVAGVSLQVHAYIGTSTYTLLHQMPPVTLQWYVKEGWWVLVAGERIQGWCGGATAGDDLYFVYTGFQMDIS